MPSRQLDQIAAELRCNPEALEWATGVPAPVRAQYAAAGPPNTTVAVAALLLADGRRIPLRSGVITTTALASLISEGQL